MTTTEKKAEPAPSKLKDREIRKMTPLELIDAARKCSADNPDNRHVKSFWVQYDEPTLAFIFEQLEAKVKALESASSSENAALDELRANVENEIKAWETKCVQHPNLLHEVSGIVAAWLQMRQMIDAVKARQQQKMKQ